MEPVAAGDEIAFEPLHLALPDVVDGGLRGIDAVEMHAFDVEPNRPTRREPREDQVLHDLLLAVDGDRPTWNEPLERDAVLRATEA